MTTDMERVVTVLEDRQFNEALDLEAEFAKLLAQVMSITELPVDSHFFNDLGADSLVMARFCAKVRKNGNLPSVSMKDIYAHPTIRGLASAFDHTTSTSGSSRTRVLKAPQTRTGAGEYLLCGTLQAFFFLAYSFVAVVVISEAYRWISSGTGLVQIYLRLALANILGFLALCALPIMVKWMIVGRWKPEPIRLWSLSYVRFWVVKTSIRLSPAARLFIGTPVYLLYLRALGAKIGKGVVIFSRRVPVCTDLLKIGAGTVIRKEALFNCYRAESGRIEIGAVTLGRNVYVGERSVLEINTSIGDGAQLGHASALHTGQSVPRNERWHGSPAQPTNLSYLRIPPAHCSTLRRAAYSTIAVSVLLLLYLPLVQALFMLSIVATSSFVDALDPGAGIFEGLVVRAFSFSLIIFFGLAVFGVLLSIGVSRVLGRLIQPDIVYPLFGLHDAAHRAIARIGRMKFFTYLFGDSSYIVSFLQLLGYQLSPVLQTGVNFGTEVMHANPSLSAVGTGTIIADGLILVNDEVSSSSFRVSRTQIGTSNFVGNDVVYPAGGKTGNNVLLGTKVMVPLDGAIREGIGLLGSPCFEIPRSVERDMRFDHLRTGEALRRGVAAKNWHDLQTIGIYLLTRWMGIFLFGVFYLAAFEFYGAVPATLSTVLFALSCIAPALFLTGVQRFLVTLHPLQPTICSIYHPDFWWAERIWKAHPIHYLYAFDGTPFKNLLWRFMGVRIGKRVFDDGVHISEPTLTTIGDESVLNYRSKIQCHSQEDGTFKCDRTIVNAECTLGVGSFVLYGVTIGRGSVLAADSFLMKGEDIPPAAIWGGNPAKEM